MLKVVNTSKETDVRSVMAQAKFYESYSRWNDEKDRYETWEESVARVMDMHRGYYKEIMNPELGLLIDEAENLYKVKALLWGLWLDQIYLTLLLSLVFLA